MKIKVLIGISAAILLSGCVGTQGGIVYSSNLKGLSLEEKALRTNSAKSFEKDINTAKFLKLNGKCYEFKYMEEQLGSELNNRIDFLKKQLGITKREDFIETLSYKKMNGNIIVFSRGNDLSTHHNLNDCFAFTDNEQEYRTALVNNYTTKQKQHEENDCISRMESGKSVTLACQDMYNKVIEAEQDALTFDKKSKGIK